MEKLTVSTPYGEEILYQATLDVAVEHLAARLIPVAESFSALPITAHLAEQLLPAAKTAWDTWAPNGMAYLELTPHSLTGFGRSVSPDEMPDRPLLSTPLECWGLAVAVAERLAKDCGARVCPLYVENALGMAVEDLRVTVGLVKVQIYCSNASNSDLSKRYKIENSCSRKDFSNIAHLCSSPLHSDLPKQKG